MASGKEARKTNEAGCGTDVAALLLGHSKLAHGVVQPCWVCSAGLLQVPCRLAPSLQHPCYLLGTTLLLRRTSLLLRLTKSFTVSHGPAATYQANIVETIHTLEELNTDISKLLKRECRESWARLGG